MDRALAVQAGSLNVLQYFESKENFLEDKKRRKFLFFLMCGCRVRLSENYWLLRFSGAEKFTIIMVRTAGLAAHEQSSWYRFR